MCNCATISAQFLQPHVVAYSSAKLNVTGNTIPDCISGYEVCFSQRVSEKKKKMLSLPVRSGNIMKIYKYSKILFVLDQKNVHLLGRQIGIPPRKNKQLSFLQPAKYTKIMKWFGSLLLFLSCEAPSPGLGSTSNAVNIAILVDRESVVNL